VTKGRGIRVQIVLALGTLMLLAFVPLSFAVSSLAKASELVARRHAVVAVAHAIAAHVRSDPSRPAEEILAAHLGESGIDALAVIEHGQITASAGERLVTSDFGAPGSSRSEAGTIQASAAAGGIVVVARAIAADGTNAEPVVRLVALYVALFALTLLIFMYFTLTRVIVRPLEGLVAATGRVARGSRELSLPTSGPRELAEVAASVETMAAKLIAEETALRAKVDELTATTKQLIDAQTQVIRSERMASVGRLAAGVAHEIGNPIAALLGMEDLLLDSTTPPDEARDFLVRMKKETERISSILRDLLDFARPESADSSGQYSPAEVKSVVDEVLALSRPQRRFRDIDVRLDIEPSLHVMMSTARLTQVLLNLMMNAAAALEGNARPTLAVRATREASGESVRLVVEDNGPGVRADVGDTIFEPFVTTKEVGQGTGLGLSVCRGLVEAANGTIDLDAKYTGGARFVITLPSS